jgi:transcriptional regulator GlxA family with amidase domain
MDPRIQVVIATMSESVADRISMWTLCRKVNLSPARLRELFKKETGLSPMRYLRDLRMQRAEQLLRTTFLSIKEVTFLSGERDVSHFVRDFKKKYGRTPSEFRAQTQSSPRS